MANLKEVTTIEAYEQARALFKAYARELEIDLSFQNFSQEIDDIEIQYARPAGCLYLAYKTSEKPIGCFGIRQWDKSTCELKRMYLKKQYRRLGIGELLLNKAIEAGYELGYKKIRLDTLPSMKSAIKLYERFGFKEIAPYRYNPIEGAKYFEKVLRLW